MKKLLNISISKTLALQAFQLIRYGTLILISIFLAKSNLTQEQIGFYESALFLASMLSFFWVSGLIQAMLPLVGNIDKEKNSKLFNVFLVLTAFSLFTLVIGFALKPILMKMETVSSLPYYGLAVIYAALSGPGFLIEYVYLLKNRPWSILNYGIAVFSAQLVGVSAAILLGYGIGGALVFLVFLSALKFILILALVLKNSRIEVSWSFIVSHLKLGIPLVGKTLVSGSAAYIDGLIVSSKFSANTFAVYRYGARDFPLVTLLANALSNSTLPDFSENDKLNQVFLHLKLRSKKLMHLLFPLTIVLIFASKPLFPVVFNPMFAESASVFAIYLLTIFSHLLFPQTIAIGLNRTKALFSISIFELAINVTLSLILINWIGIVGVAIATVIAYWIEKVTIIAYLYIKFGIKPSVYIPVLTYFTYSVLTIVAMTISLIFI